MIYNDMILEAVSPSLSKYNDMKEELKDNKLDNDKITETALDKNFNRLYEMIASESTIITNILNSISTLKENGILIEETEPNVSKSITDKIQLLWKKVQLFFQKIKIELIDKFNSFLYRSLDKKLNDLEQIIRNIENPHRFHLDVITIETHLKAYNISSESIDQYNEYIRYYDTIINNLNEVYDNPLEFMSGELHKDIFENIEDKKVPTIENEEFEVHINSADLKDYQNALKQFIKYTDDDNEKARGIIKDIYNEIKQNQEVLSKQISKKDYYKEDAKIRTKCTLTSMNCYMKQLKAAQKLISRYFANISLDLKNAEWLGNYCKSM